MGKDFWNYGVHENMREIEALTQYAHEQGLIDRKVAVEELFRPLDVRDVEGLIGGRRLLRTRWCMVRRSGVGHAA